MCSVKCGKFAHERGGEKCGVLNVKGFFFYENLRWRDGGVLMEKETFMWLYLQSSGSTVSTVSASPLPLLWSCISKTADLLFLPFVMSLGKS